MKHDAQGFLLGERINAPTSNASPAIAVLGAVRRDVSVIRRLLESRGPGQTARSAGGRRSDGLSSTASAAVSATVRRAVSESVARASTSRGQAVTPMLRDARGRFIRATGVRNPGATPSAGSVAVAVPAGAVRSAGRLATADGRSVADSDRDVRGRFAGGGGGGGSDYAGESVIGKIASSLDGISDAVTGAENIDPTISALKEVRDAVSPVGRGFMALHNRMAERKKDRWYSRILKAITGRKDEAVVGGGGDVGRGSFFGTMLGELGGKLLGSLGGAAGSALGFLGGILSRVFLPVAAAWGAWELGQWIGGKIYEWLDKSGILTKAFDAFDSMVGWFKEKFKAAGDAAKNAVNTASKAASDAQLGSDEARYGPLDAETRREARLGSRGAAPDSAAYKAGQAAGTVMRGVDTAGGVIKKLLGVEGKKRVYENSDGSVVERNGGSVSWRNNNPGNLKFEFAGSADKTVRSRRTRAQALEAAQKRYEGVVDLDQFGNAIFASEAHGRAAKAKLLQGMHGGLTVDQMLPKYAVSDYSGTANHAAYAAGIYKSAEAKGLNLRGKKIGDMNPAEVSALLDGMKRVEGFKVGTTTGIRAASVPAVASTSIPAIKPAAVPMTAPDKPAVVQAPPVPERLGSARQTPVVISKDDVNQDVRDRRLAHIVTGGIGG